MREQLESKSSQGNTPLRTSPGNSLMFMSVVALLATAACPLLAQAEGMGEKYMHVKLVLSDSEIFVNDGLAYKVMITNISRSLIICNPDIEPRFSCVIEGKSPGGDWREIWDYPRVIKSFERGSIRISAGETWVEYGQVFLTKGKAPVFSKEGKWELRGHVKTVIGNVVSDPVSLTVKRWPKRQEPVDKRYEPLGQMVLLSPR